MEHIAALLLIVGCSENLAQCRELPAPVPIFETSEECDAELPASLRGFTGRYPRVFAKCVFADPAMEEEDATLVWDVRPDGTLDASIESASVLVASERRHGENSHIGQN
jgi:hypothetical protein